jgi:hypothetical protein
MSSACPPFEGKVKGSVVGLFFSSILTTTIGIITRATCPLGIGLRWLGYIVLAIYATWIAGGICGVGLAEFNPTFFRNTFFQTPSDHWQMLRFAWVGGSIWGAEPGRINGRHHCTAAVPNQLAKNGQARQRSLFVLVSVGMRTVASPTRARSLATGSSIITVVS